MTVKTDLRERVRNMILLDYRPIEDSIRIVREKRADKDAAFAVAFEDRDGRPATWTARPVRAP